MGLLRTARYRARALFKRGQLDTEMEDEMLFHLEMLTREFEDDGLSSREAKRKARLDFGGLERMKLYAQDARKVRWLEDLFFDARFALRQMRASPIFALVIAITLAIGIGTSATILGLGKAVLFDSLPFEKPERLVWIQNAASGELTNRTTRLDNFLDWQAENSSFESLAGFNAFSDWESWVLSDPKSTFQDRIESMEISEGFLETLGVAPALGRTFRSSDHEKEGVLVTILLHSLWQEAFGGDEDIVGKHISFSGKEFLVLGVMPASFDFNAVFAPGKHYGFLTPLPHIEARYEWGNMLSIIGRLKPGVAIEQAAEDLTAISAGIRNRTDPGELRHHHEINVNSLDEAVRGPQTLYFYLLTGSAACLLLIACVNVSSLLIARGLKRQREFALRAAVGANRWRLFRQSATEGTLLAFCGALLPLPLVLFALRSIAGLEQLQIPLLNQAAFDLGLLLFVAIVAVFMGLSCGGATTLAVWKRKPREVLRDGCGRGAQDTQTTRIRGSLVVVQMALTTAVWIIASFLFISVNNLMQVDLGFDPKEALTLRVDSAERFDTSEERSNHFWELGRYLRASSDLGAVGLSDVLPFGRNRVWPVNRVDKIEADAPDLLSSVRLVDEGYLAAMGIELISGRFIAFTDVKAAPLAIVINKALRDKLIADKSPLGLSIGNEIFTGKVVGVVDNVRHRSFSGEAIPVMYLSLDQFGDAFTAVELVARSELKNDRLIPRLTSAIESHGPMNRAGSIRALETLIERKVAPRRWIASTLTAFAIASLILTSVGVYGMVWYSLRQRSRELAVCLAIGAPPLRLFADVFREGLSLSLSGIGFGVAIALLVSQFISRYIFGISPSHFGVYAAVGIALLSVATLATLVSTGRSLPKKPALVLR